MKIVLEISDETFRQYARGADLDMKAAAFQLQMGAKSAVLTELRGEVSCGTQVIKSESSEIPE